MLKVGIEFHERLMGRLRVNERTEGEVTVLFQNAKLQIQDITSLQNKREELTHYVKLLSQ
jgi:hypothetical protein